MADAKGIKAGEAHVQVGLKSAPLMAGLRAASQRFRAFVAEVKKVDVGQALSTGYGKATKTLKWILGSVTGVAASLLGAAKVFAETDRRLLNPAEAKAADAMRLSLAGISQSAKQANAALVTALQPGIVALIEIIRIVIERIKQWIVEHKDLLAGVNDFIAGLRDALAAGDLKLAAEILWAGLKVAFAAGVNSIIEPWTKWKTAFQQTASDALHGVVLFFSNTWAKIEGTIINVTSFFEDAWARVLNWFRQAWAGTVAWISTKLVNLKAMLGVISKETARRERAAIEAERNRKVQGSEGDKEARLAKIERDRMTMQKGIERDRQAREEAIAENNLAANKLIADANRSQIGQAQRDLDEKVKQLRQLTKKAKEKVAAQGGTKLAPVIDLQSKTSTVGTFDAAGIRGLSGTRPLQKVEENTKRTADEAKRTAAELKKLNDRATKGGLAFGR